MRQKADLAHHKNAAESRHVGDQKTPSGSNDGHLAELQMLEARLAATIKEKEALEAALALRQQRAKKTLSRFVTSSCTIYSPG